MTHGGFKVGDCAVPDRTLFGHYTETFTVVGLETDLYDRPVVRVRAVGEPRSYGVLFYPDELFRPGDGTRPA